MNAAAFSAVSRFEASNYIGPINPPVMVWQKAPSKVRRWAGLQGSFFFFSRHRLTAIANAVHSKCKANAHLDFFHGFTPWIMTKPERPYITWSDCTFRDYIDIFCRREKFRHEDLERIEEAEAAWLRNARLVLFTSEWAADRAVHQYALDARRVTSVGVFGEIEMPVRDVYAGGKEFAFMSTNFEAKGGRIVLSAFQELRKRDADVSLIVVGDKPSDLAPQPGLEFVGFLRKEVPSDLEQFRKILGRVRALVHPTKSDITPLVIVEAGYFGCPAISSRRFGIPELVDHDRTGILLQEPSSTSVSDAMAWILEHTDEYERMRKCAWAKAHGQHSKQKFEERLVANVREVVREKDC